MEMYAEAVASVCETCLKSPDALAVGFLHQLLGFLHLLRPAAGLHQAAIGHGIR